jgi:hypothetical protein
MKKHALIFVMALVAVAIAVPALADVQFQYGGQFRARFTADNNVYDGTDKAGFYGTNYNSDDNARWIDQRTRLYFSFVASQNLKLVTKFELGTTAWGMSSNTSSSVGNTGANGGGNVGADAVSVEVKNAYLQFNIPNTPTTAIIGVQGAVLLDSWIVDDDIPAAIFVTKLDPFKVTIGYVGGQYGWERKMDPNYELPLTNSSYNVDDVLLAVDYADGPFKASLVGFFQDAHDSDVSINPTTLSTPVRNYTGISGTTNATAFPFFTPITVGKTTVYPSPRNNYLFDLGFNFTYKVDWLMAYIDFVKNLGSTDLYNSINGTVGPLPNTAGVHKIGSIDYTGWMVDSGVTYFCGPWTANLGGFYTSGPDISSNPEANIAGGAGHTGPFQGINSSKVNWFTYPLATNKYFSEIIGGGVLGDDVPNSGWVNRGYKLNQVASNIGITSDTTYWRGQGWPTNLWTVTTGGSYQLAEQTKISGSYWYFGTPSSVPVSFSGPVSTTANYKMSSSIGHELDLYIDQGIVDGLTLTLVGAYLIADDAFCPLPVPYGTASQALSQLNSMRANPMYYSSQADNAYEVGARLQWNF